MAAVYGHYLPCTDKWYIGIITKNNTIERRWNKGKGYINNNQPKFENAILKYGWDSFQHIVFFDSISDEEAIKKERELIKKYNSIENGYNILPGNSIADAPNKGRKGKKNNNSQKAAASRALKKYYSEHDSKLGNNHSAKKIKGIHIDTGEILEFNSLSEAAIYLNKNNVGHISAALHGRKPHAYKYKWIFL